MLNRRRFVGLAAAAIAAPSILVRARAPAPTGRKAGAHRGAVHAGRLDRHHRAPGRQPPAGGVGPVGGDREQARRRRQHRRRHGRPFRSRRLHHLHRRPGHGHQPVPLSVAELRSGRRFRAGDAADHPAQHDVRAEFLAGEIGAGVHRLLQRQQGQGHLRLVRQRHHAASVRRAVQAAGQGRDDPHPLSRRRAGDQRSHSRPRRRHLRQHALDHLRMCRAASCAGSR